jgi:nitrate/nitrite transporter NarK
VRLTNATVSIFVTGFLGGVFVPCQAWPTAFFDKKIVGRSNALVAGWGNMGGAFHLSHDFLVSA